VLGVAAAGEAPTDAITVTAVIAARVMTEEVIDKSCDLHGIKDLLSRRRYWTNGFAVCRPKVHVRRSLVCPIAYWQTFVTID